MEKESEVEGETKQYEFGGTSNLLEDLVDIIVPVAEKSVSRAGDLFVTLTTIKIPVQRQLSYHNCGVAGAIRIIRFIDYPGVNSHFGRLLFGCHGWTI